MTGEVRQTAEADVMTDAQRDVFETALPLLTHLDRSDKIIEGVWPGTHEDAAPQPVLVAPYKMNRSDLVVGTGVWAVQLGDRKARLHSVPPKALGEGHDYTLTVKAEGGYRPARSDEIDLIAGIVAALPVQEFAAENPASPGRARRQHVAGRIAGLLHRFRGQAAA